MEQLEVIIFCISISLALITVIVGMARGLTAAKTLGGGVMSMVVTWVIFIAILILAYNIIYFSGLPYEEGSGLKFKYLASIFILLVPICLLRIIWGLADYVKELQKLSE